MTAALARTRLQEAACRNHNLACRLAAIGGAAWEGCVTDWRRIPFDEYNALLVEAREANEEFTAARQAWIEAGKP